MKISLLNTVYAFFVFVIIGSCSEDIALVNSTESRQLVVFGWISDENRPYEVSVTRSVAFNSLSDYEFVSGCQIYVIDDLGNRYAFIENSAEGKYLSDSTEFIGRINMGYVLDITLQDGTQVISQREILHDLPAVDSVFVQEFVDLGDPFLPPEETSHFVAGLINDDPSMANFFQWKVFVNDELRNLPSEMVLFDDKFTNGNRFRFDASNVLFQEIDHVYLEHRSLSSFTYQYYLQLQGLTDSEAGSVVPASYVLRGNISSSEGEDVLGIFGASAVQLVSVQSVN